MATFHVELVSPERELWSGEAEMVVARTLDGEIGILANHSPVIGTLVDGGIVRVLRAEGREDELVAAVDRGFLSVDNNRVSILAEVAELGDEVDVEEARGALERARSGDDEEASAAEAARWEARLRAAGREV